MLGSFYPLAFWKRVVILWLILAVGTAAYYYTNAPGDENTAESSSNPTEEVQGELSLQEKLVKAESAYQIERSIAARAINVSTFWDRYPASFPCPLSVQRVGASGDGGKAVCGFSEIRKLPQCIVYSCGIANDVSFDRMVLEQTNCSLRMFDISKIQSNPAALLAEFGPTRVSYSEDGISGSPSNSLKTIMAKHGDDFIDVLKMDIELAEFRTLARAMADFPEGLPIGQLQVEIHPDHFKAADPDPPAFRSWYRSLETAGLRPFFREPNPIYPLNLWEYAFLSVKHGMFKIKK